MHFTLEGFDLPAAMACLIVVFGAAVGLGVLIHNIEVRKGHLDGRDRHGVGVGIGAALGFLGSTAGFLLGVLMLASVDHYNETKRTVDDEAFAYSAAFDSAAGLAPDDQAKIQRDLACLMRSVATNSWAATEAQSLAGSPNTHAWRARALSDAKSVDPKSTVQQSSLEKVLSETVDASTAGQKRLVAAASDLPVALWVLVYVSIFVLTFGLTTLLYPYPVLAVANLMGILILTAAMVWALSVFAEPFSQGDVVFISPRTLNAVIVRLEGTYPGSAWEPCEQLAPLR
jgi:hypothetical protein